MRILKTAVLSLVLYITMPSVPAWAQIKVGIPINPMDIPGLLNVLPINVAGVPVMPGYGYDCPDPAKATPICICPLPVPPFFRIGFTVSLWEPFAFTEVVKDPFYFPFFGQDLSGGAMAAFISNGVNSSTADTGTEYAFYHAHQVIFPVFQYMKMLIDVACLEMEEFDIHMITEVDPIWNNDETAKFVFPESILVANFIAQMSCMADAASVTAYIPLDWLFWCIGSGGSMYPVTGNVQDEKLSQANQTVAARFLARLSREQMLLDTAVNLCAKTPTTFLLRSHYKLELLRPTIKVMAQPLGRTETIWGAGANPQYGALGPADDFLWMSFRKRACCAF